jgi:hypothetical protein
LQDDPTSRKLPIDDLEAKIIACLEREPYSSGNSLAETLEVSPAAVLSRLHHSLDLQNFQLHWVSHRLTDRPQYVRVAKYGKLLRALEVMQRTHSRHIIRGDESWFDLEYQHASQRSVSRDEVPQGVDPTIGTATLWSRLFAASPASTCQI